MVFPPSSGLKKYEYFTTCYQHRSNPGPGHPANDCRQSFVRKPSHLLSLMISPLDVITVKQIIQLLIFAHPSEVETEIAMAVRLWLFRE